MDLTNKFKAIALDIAEKNERKETIALLKGEEDRWDISY
jgi:hypothetical protein